MLSAFCVIPPPLPIYLTYGVIQGLGQGLVYTTVLSAAQKWFPGRTGFGSGIIVTANGLCGVLLAPVSRPLLELGGPRLAFLVTGGVAAAAWILRSICFCMPDKEWEQAAVPAAKRAW